MSRKVWHLPAFTMTSLTPGDSHFFKTNTQRRKINRFLRRRITFLFFTPEVDTRETGWNSKVWSQVAIFLFSLVLLYAAVKASPPCVCVLWPVSPLWMFNSRPGLCLCAQNGTQHIWPWQRQHFFFYIHSFAEPPQGFHRVRLCPWWALAMQSGAGLVSLWFWLNTGVSAAAGE